MGYFPSTPTQKKKQKKKKKLVSKTKKKNLLCILPTSYVIYLTIGFSIGLHCRNDVMTKHMHQLTCNFRARESTELYSAEASTWCEN